MLNVIIYFQQQCCELKTTWHIIMCITNNNTMLNRKYSTVLLPEHLTSVDKEIQIVCQEQLLLVLMCFQKFMEVHHVKCHHIFSAAVL